LKQTRSLSDVNLFGALRVKLLSTPTTITRFSEGGPVLLVVHSF